MHLPAVIGSAVVGHHQLYATLFFRAVAGEIRSGFLMTEPDKASSDGSNISLSIRQEGNELVMNGSKWWYVCETYSNLFRIRC